MSLTVLSRLLQKDKSWVGAGYSLEPRPGISFPLISLLGVHASFLLRAGKIKQKALSYCRAWETRQGISQLYNKVNWDLFPLPSPGRGEPWAGLLLMVPNSRKLCHAIQDKEGERHLWHGKSKSGVIVPQQMGWKLERQENTKFSLWLKRLVLQKEISSYGGGVFALRYLSD